MISEKVRIESSAISQNVIIGGNNNNVNQRISAEEPFPW